MTLLDLVPFPVVLPLAVAAVLLALGHLTPRPVPESLSLATALVVGGLDLVLALAARGGPLVYWFGGWTPQPDVTLGIAFAIDPASGGFAAFVGLLFAATFVYAWGFFEEVQATFAVLMLLFLAALQGFVLTHDLFNMFVWFEVMSVAAFALTGFSLRRSSLAGALNFTVCNSLAATFMLAGIGLLYAGTATLDFDRMGRAVALAGADPVVIGGFCLVGCALLIKTALVPFQFWLADAHAVAPSPVSVIFSGAMVPSALFMFAKLAWQVFSGSPVPMDLVHGLLMGLGALTAAAGGLLAWSQRHLKRLLAFSTISHMGICVTGLASPDPIGTAGLLAYLLGHGLVKGALFMLVGILLATRASVDELDLRGLGRKGIWPAGIAMAISALLLGGAPIGILHGGADLIAASGPGIGVVFIRAAVLIGTALTGAAVLRATGRIYLGLGPDPGEQAEAPTEDERERANRPLWLMLAPVVLLLALAIFVPSERARAVAVAIVPLFAPAAGAITLPEPTEWTSAEPWLATLFMLLVATLALSRDKLPKVFTAATDRGFGPLSKGLNRLHSGIVTDYVVWITVGFALFVSFAAA